MPSTYTLNNGIELIGTGEQSGTWGDTTNTNLQLLDTALDGQVTVALSSAGSSGSPNNLPVSDGTTSNGRNRLVIFSDSSDLGATAYVQLTPNDSEKIIYVRNSLSGSRSIVLFQGTYNASNDYEVPAGTTAVVFFNGAGTGAVAANVFNNAYFDSLRLGGVSVTAILDEDDMSSDSATALATQQSIKKYVDDKAAAQDTLAEVLANGNTTGGTDIAVSTGDDITFADSSKAIFGAGSDLQIYSDGTDGYIDNVTGDFYIRDTTGGTLHLQAKTGEEGIVINDDGSVDLYRNNVLKMSTTSTGIDVTGDVGGDSATISGDLTVDTDTLYVDSTNDRVGINTSSPSYAIDVVGLTDNSIYAEFSNNNARALRLSSFAVGANDNAGHDINASSSVGALSFSIDENQAMRIDSSRRVLIGHDSSPTDIWGGQQNRLQVIGNSWANSGVGIHNYNNGTSSANISFSKSRSGTVGTSGTVVANGDRLGHINYVGDDGTDQNSSAASISVIVDGAPGTDDMPGRIVFSTTADGASTATERMRIDSSGNVEIGGSGSIFTSSFNETVLAVTSASSNTNAAIEIRSNTGAADTYSSAIHFINEAAGSSSHQKRIAQIQVETSSNINSGDLILLTNPDVTSGGPQEAMRIDSSQRVLIGHTSSIPNGGDNQQLQVTGTGSSDGISLARFNTTYGAYFTIGRSGSGTVGTYTAVPINDEIGRMQWAVADGTDMSSVGAMINAVTEQQAASNDVPTRLVFSTTSDGAQAPTERMRINSAGKVRIGSGDPSVNFEVVGSGDQFIFLQTTDTSDGVYIKADSGGDGTEFQTAGGQNQFGFRTSGTLAMTIDSSQRVLMGAGTNAASTVANGWWNGSSSYSGILNVQNVNDGSASKYVSLAVSRHSNDAESGQLGFAKSRGSTANSKTTVGVGDNLGLLTFQGADGSNFAEAARIAGATDGTAAGDDMPGRLQFYTTADGAASSTERMRITKTGLVSVGSQQSFGTATGTVVQTGSSSSLANALIMSHADVTAGVGNTAQAFCELNLKLDIQGKLRFHAEVDAWFYINTGPDRGSAKYIFAGYFNGGSSAVDRYDVYNTDTDNIGIPVLYTSGSQKGIKVQFTNTNGSNGLFGQMKVNVTWNP